jgi:hypothetical protein
MKYWLPLFFLFALFCSSSAFAIVGHVAPKDKALLTASPVFTCTPAGFTLTKSNSGLRLQGSLQVPTSGFSYEITQEEPGPDGSIHGTLHVKRPDGMAAQVISSLAIDHTFSGEGDRLTVDIDKPVGKDAAIECKMAETP